MAVRLTSRLWQCGRPFLHHSAKCTLRKPTVVIPNALSRYYSGKSPPGDNYKFLSSHEWAHLEGDVATTGISDHAQDELGDVVFVDLPNVGRKVKQLTQYSSIESVKAANDLYAPMSGQVLEVNAELEDNAAMVNKSPYQDGWIAKVKISDPSEFDNLLTFEEYGKALEES